MYEFNKIIDRRDTASFKWKPGFFGENAGEDLIPMWVADSDYQTAPEIIEALAKRVEHGIFGYTYKSDSHLEAAQNWFKKHYGIKAEKDELCFTPGVVCALAMGIRALTREGDGVMFMSPVYGPFAKTVSGNNRKPVTITSLHGELPSDEELEAAYEEGCKVFLLCNPHNPGGKAYNKAECKRVSEFAAKHDMYIISDDIHADFLYEEADYCAFSTCDEYAAEHTVNCFAPSKTFNIAGLSCSVIYIKNPEIREKFNNELAKAHIGVNLMGLEGMRAAYTKGEPWLKAQLEHLKKNRDILYKGINEVEGLSCEKPDSTYLLWVDCHEFMKLHGLETQEDLYQFFIKAGLGLNSGTDYGPEGEGFMRINFACPTQYAKEAVARIKKAAAEDDN